MVLDRAGVGGGRPLRPHSALGMLLVSILLSLPLLGQARSPDPVRWVEEASREYGTLMSEFSLLTWTHMTGGDTSAVTITGPWTLEQWRHLRCSQARAFRGLPPLMSRAVYLVCRGPDYVTPQLERECSELRTRLEQLYFQSTVCRAGHCLKVEPDLARLMRNARDPDLLLWAWAGWRRAVGPEGLRLYPRFVEIQNIAARVNGYQDVGQCWREELEVEDLQGEADRLLAEIQPFHRLLHALVRHRLAQYYGRRLVSPTAPIPAHLLGDMWSQNWSALFKILLNSSLDLDEGLQKKYKNVTELVKEAEKYYISIGLPPMTEKFWKNSVLTDSRENSIECHASAADLFGKDDYRMLVCTSVNWEDFYIITHEMGHVQYYMSYKDLPSIFKNAPNSAFQESVGDLIMLAMETPANIKRLGIVDQDKDIDIPILLFQALQKLPHIIFAYNIDKWRWSVQASNISVEDYNKVLDSSGRRKKESFEVWWDYRTANEGIEPPIPRQADSFDPISKYHVADNTPYIRYFLSDFLIFQYYDVLCQMKNEMYGINDQDFHLCDLHGFKEAGEKLRLMMSHGSMYRWDKVLSEFSGGKYKKMSAEPLLKYFQPLISWLQKVINEENIPVGW